jgi:hypothetical protein
MYHIHIYIYTYIHVCHVYVVTVATTVREITTCRREKKFVRMVHVIMVHVIILHMVRSSINFHIRYMKNIKISQLVFSMKK